MMRILDNGIYRDATPDEVAALEKEVTQQPAPEPTTDERIAALEEELKAAKNLLGLED